MFLIDGVLLYKRESKHVKKTANKFLVLSLISAVPVRALNFRWHSGPRVSLPKTFSRAYRFIPEMRRAGLLQELAVIPFPLKNNRHGGTSALFAMRFISCLWRIIEPINPNGSVAERYLESMCWSITTLTTVGYGDITPKTALGENLYDVCDGSRRRYVWFCHR